MIYNIQTVALISKAIKVLENGHKIQVEGWYYNKLKMEFGMFLKSGFELDKMVNQIKDIITDFPMYVELMEYEMMNTGYEKECIENFHKDLKTKNPYPLFLMDELMSHILEENMEWQFGNHLYKIKSIEPVFDIDYSKKYSRKYFDDSVEYVGKTIPRCSMFVREFKINLKNTITDYILLEDKGSIFEIKDQKDIFYKLCNKLRYPKRRVKF